MRTSRQQRLALGLLALAALATAAAVQSLAPDPELPTVAAQHEKRYDHSGLNGANHASTTDHLFDSVLIAHAVCGFLAWQVFAPLTGFLSLSSSPRALTAQHTLQWALIVPLTLAACVLGVYVVRTGEYSSAVSAHMVLGWLVMILAIAWVALPRHSALKPTTSKLRQSSLVALTLATLTLGGGSVQLGFGELLGTLPRYIWVTCTVITLLPVMLSIVYLPFRWRQHRESGSEHSFLATLLMPSLLHHNATHRNKGGAIGMVPPRPKSWDNASAMAPSFASFTTYRTDERTLVNQDGDEEDDAQGTTYAKGMHKVARAAGEGWEGPKDREEYERYLVEQRIAEDSQQGYDGPGLAQAAPTPIQFEHREADQVLYQQEQAAMPLPMRNRTASLGGLPDWDAYSPATAAAVRMELPALNSDANRFPGSRPAAPVAPNYSHTGFVAAMHAQAEMRRTATGGTASSGPTYVWGVHSSPIIPPTFGTLKSPPADRRAELQRQLSHRRQRSSGSGSGSGYFIPKRLSLGSGAPIVSSPPIAGPPRPLTPPSPSTSILSLGSTAVATAEHFVETPTGPAGVPLPLSRATTLALAPATTPRAAAAEVPLPLSRSASLAPSAGTRAEGEERTGEVDDDEEEEAKEDAMSRVPSGKWFSNK